jgi:Transcriptional regulators
MPVEDRKKNRVTLLDVAQRAGVSRATASLVVRKSPLVGAQTRARVEEAMAALGYVYNMGAARLRAERSNAVGVVVPNLTNPFFAELLSGIEAVIDRAGMVVLLVNSGDTVERQDVLMRRLREHGVDGIILCAAAGTQAGIVQQLLDWDLPVVQTLRHISPQLDYAGADYAAGMRQAVDHLADLGHTAISFAVHGPVHSAYDERIKGFGEAMRARGLKSGHVIRVPDQTAQIPQAAKALFEASRPTAIICFNDVIAVGLNAGLSDLGLKVGKDVSLVGFDDVTEADIIRPRLTSISTAPVTIGEDSARLLLDRIREPQLPPRWIIKPTQLHVRQSSAAAALPLGIHKAG